MDIQREEATRAAARAAVEAEENERAAAAATLAQSHPTLSGWARAAGGSAAGVIGQLLIACSHLLGLCAVPIGARKLAVLGQGFRVLGEGLALVLCVLKLESL